MNNVLLLGGTGFIGRHVCEKLHRQGWRITVPTRRARNAASVASATVELARCPAPDSVVRRPEINSDRIPLCPASRAKMVIGSVIS